MWFTFRDLWPRNGWDPFRHFDPLYENSFFPYLPGFSHKSHWTQANQILPDIRGLKELTNNCKNFAKIRPKNCAPHLSWIFCQHVLVTSLLNTAYLRNETSHRQTKLLVSIYNVSLKYDILPWRLTQKRLMAAEGRPLYFTRMGYTESAAITLQPS